MEKVVRIRLGDLNPTQPDDGVPPISSGPIQIYSDMGKTYVKHGHHRYYDALHINGPEGRIDAVWKPNPYTDW